MKTRIPCLFLAAVLLALSAGGTSAQEAVGAVINAPVGGSIAEIVAFYNQHANTVKTADRITIIKQATREMDMEIPRVLRALMPSNSTWNSPYQSSTVTETFVNGEGTDDAARKLSDFLPVRGKPFVSQLRASHVQSASCVRRGDEWIVTIMLKDEPLDTMLNNMGNTENMSETEREALMDNFLFESGYGSSMDLSMMGDEREDSQQRQGGNGNVDSRLLRYEGGFQNGRIVAAFNQKGQMTSLVHSYNMNMNVSLLLVRMRMNSSMKQDYQFLYPLS